MLKVSGVNDMDKQERVVDDMDKQEIQDGMCHRKEVNDTNET